MAAPLSARELSEAKARHQLMAALLDSRRPFGRAELIDNLIDHRMAVRDEIRRQDAK